MIPVMPVSMCRSALRLFSKIPDSAFGFHSFGFHFETHRSAWWFPHQCYWNSGLASSGFNHQAKTFRAITSLRWVTYIQVFVAVEVRLKQNSVENVYIVISTGQIVPYSLVSGGT